MVEWATEAWAMGGLCTVVMEATTGWVCMASSKTKESSSHLTLTLHISSILDVTSNQQWLVSTQV